MKSIRKIMTLAIAMLMMIGMGTAVFAEEGKPADTSISVSGLQANDTVNFYKVLAYDETANETGGWVAAEGFGGENGLTKDDIQKMLGLGDYATGKSKAAQAGIDAVLAGRIALMAGDATAKFGNVAASSGTATQATTNVGDAGLYVALVTPGTADYLYNPVFVAADYTAGGTNSQAAVTTLSYQPASLAKKEDVTLTKEIDGTTDTKYDVNVGDTVSFTITSKVPAYSSAYQDPIYEINDTMESGLEVKETPSVAIAGVTLAAADYTITVAPDKNSFKVVVNASGLAKVAATGSAQTITVKYNATVTSLEDATVSEKENEATVKFSNNPEDSDSYSLLEDKTRTYSFTIDGNLLGYTGTSYETDELIKVGLNADGTPATEKKKYHSDTTWTELSPLAGAVFGLYTNSDCTEPYTNTTITGSVTSDANGRLKITGLDAGIYYLKETSAPAGYVADNRTFTITIEAEYEEIPGGEYTNTDEIKVKYDAYKVLKGYTVAVNDGTNTTTSTYNISNKGPNDHKVVDKATYRTITGEDGGDFAGDNVTPIKNVKGTELPSTGGIGTTIFYALGGMMILGAGVLLVSKKRMAE